MFEEREQELPLNHIVTIHLEDGRIVHSSTEELPRDAFSEEPLEVDPFTAERKEYEAREEGERPRREKIHPELIRRLNERPAADDREQILVTLRDDMALPRFPAPAIYEPRESETNRAVMQRTEELIREITNRRADNYERVIRELSESYEYVEVLETYWLINALLVEMPLAAVYGLARREDVLSVEPRYKELQDLPREQPAESYYVFGVRVPRPGTQLVGSAIDPDVVDVWVPRPGFHIFPSAIDPDVVGVRVPLPPGVKVSPWELDPNRGTVRYARDLINSDAFFSHVPESNSGWMALFDTGVRFTHQILSNRSVIGERRDCVRGGKDCKTGPNMNLGDVYSPLSGHGTSCAAIICANANQGDEYRGVTRIRLDSWRIITELGVDPSEKRMLDSRAVLRAFEEVVRLRYLVISQSTGDPGGMICSPSRCWPIGLSMRE
jgi:hypothetical protein